MFDSVMNKIYVFNSAENYETKLYIETPYHQKVLML